MLFRSPLPGVFPSLREARATHRPRNDDIPRSSLTQYANAPVLVPVVLSELSAVQDPLVGVKPGRWDFIGVILPLGFDIHLRLVGLFHRANL